MTNDKLGKGALNYFKTWGRTEVGHNLRGLGQR